MFAEQPIIPSFTGSYAFLSNFYSAATMAEGIRYPTSEHAFQAMKTLDLEQRQRIAEAPTPGRAKQLGRSVQLRPDWDSYRIEAMRQVLRSKFSDPLLRDQLLATGDATLVEGNQHGDRFWGQVGSDGTNWLGRLLMELRASIRSETPHRRSLFC